MLATLLCCTALPAQRGDGAEQPPRREPKQEQKVERPKDVVALFAAFASVKGLSARYTEEKHLSLLAVPLKSSGALHFLSPSHLSRVVEKPEKQTLTITETELRMADKTSVEVIDLRQSDRVRLFVTSLMRVFQGDREALAKHYDVAYVLPKDSDTKWRLELTPKTEALQQILKQLVLHGDRDKVTGIERTAPNGDRTVTTIVEVDSARTFTAAEKQQLFGIAPEKADATGKRADGAR